MSPSAEHRIQFEILQPDIVFYNIVSADCAKLVVPFLNPNGSFSPSEMQQTQSETNWCSDEDHDVGDGTAIVVEVSSVGVHAICREVKCP